MALLAVKSQPENDMEESVARLESDVEHIKADVSDMKTDIRRLNVKVDDVKDSLAAFREETKVSIVGLKAEMQSMGAAIRAETKDSITSLRDEMKDSFAALRHGRIVNRVWWLLICGGMLGVMARGFKWI